MGVMLMLFGLLGLLFALVALAVGRLWFIRSRRQAARASAASVATFVAGGLLLDSQIGSPGLGIAMMVGAGLLALGAMSRVREQGSIDSAATGAIIAAAVVGFLGLGIYADATHVDLDAAGRTDWVETAFALDRELEVTSSAAFGRRADPAAREEWAKWAEDWEARRRDAWRACNAAARAGRLSERQGAACEAIDVMDDVLRAYRDLITDPTGNARLEDLRKENLELARRLVNEALDRAAPAAP